MQKGRGIREQCAGRRVRIVCLGVAVTTLLMPRAATAIVGHYVASVANTHDFFVLPTEGHFFAMLHLRLGYDQWQVGFDSGADQVPLLAGVLDSVHAAGVQLGVPKWGIALKYLHEFEARQRFQGGPRAVMLPGSSSRVLEDTR